MRLSNFLCYSVAALSTMMLTTFLRCGLFILSTLFMTTIVGAESMTMLQKPSTPVFRTYKYPITSWVAPYAVAKTKAALESNDGAKANITHLGLQFWLPTTEGKAKLIEMDEVTEAAIIELRDWGHANGIRVMLCVFNHNGKEWDWPLAKAGFAEHKAEFVKSLVSEMERFGLDGIDIDLEGNGCRLYDRPFQRTPRPKQASDGGHVLLYLERPEPELVAGPVPAGRFDSVHGLRRGRRNRPGVARV